MFAKSAMQQWGYKYLAMHMDGTAPPTHSRVGQSTRVRQGTAGKKKVEALFAELKNQIGLRRLRHAQTEVRAGAVLPGSGGPEHQAARALPRPTHNTVAT
jgi:hypothetical protein